MTGPTRPRASITLRGADQWKLAEAIWEFMSPHLQPTRSDHVLYKSKRWRKVRENWRDQLPWGREHFQVYSEPYFFHTDDDYIHISLPPTPYLTNPKVLLETLAPLPFDTISVGPAYREWTEPEFEKTHPRFLRGLGMGHRRYGFGALFKGAAHDQLTSRRKLTYGPWRLLRDEAHDVTLVQFHDHHADAHTAYTQAGPPTLMLGYSRFYCGCYFHEEHPFRTEPRGTYNRETRRMRFVDTDGYNKLSPEKILDWKAAAWFHTRETGEPVEGVDLVYFDEADARAARKVCWYHDIRLLWWKDQHEHVDMMQGYQPDPLNSKPDWVIRLDGA